MVLELDILKIPGVAGVHTRRFGDALHVDVLLSTFDFETYDRVVQYELELERFYPGVKFRFNIMPNEVIYEG